MKFEIDGSGVRKAIVELTDCEIKDAAVVLKEISDGSLAGHPAAVSYKYGCVTITPIR